MHWDTFFDELLLSPVGIIGTVVLLMVVIWVRMGLEKKIGNTQANPKHEKNMQDFSKMQKLLFGIVIASALAFFAYDATNFMETAPDEVFWGTEFFIILGVPLLVAFYFFLKKHR